MEQAYRPRWLAARALLVVALIANAACAAEPWVVEGRVVGVSDGDTITVLDSEKKQHKVRVNGIDAPEKGQAFGERSRQSLAQMAHGRTPSLSVTRSTGTDVRCARCGSTLDCPRCGKTLDVGPAQISVGLASWFERYANEQSLEDRGRYKSEEEEARLRKHGLWQDRHPVPPWEWRNKGRAGQAHESRPSDM